MSNDKEKRLKAWCGEEIDEVSGVRILNFHIEMTEEMYKELHGRLPANMFFSSLIEHLVKVVKREIMHSKDRDLPLRMGYLSHRNFDAATGAYLRRDMRSELERENERQLNRMRNREVGGAGIGVDGVERERFAMRARMSARMGMESNIRPSISPPFILDTVPDPMPKGGLWRRLKRYFYEKKLGFKIIRK